MMEFVRITKKEEYALLELDRGKVNALNHQMTREIRQAINQLGEDPGVRGIILTGKPHYFSAGLDLIELSQYNEQQIRDFWTDFLGMMLDLAKFKKPAIAAISGHSPAGGAVLAICCDFRFMADDQKYVIGLNEVSVGINITAAIFKLYSFWLGQRQAYQALIQGQLFRPAEALQLGLVDELVQLENLLPLAEEKMRTILKVSDSILLETKRTMRLQLWKEIDVPMDQMIEERAKYWMSEESQRTIKAVVSKLIGGK